MSFCLSVCLSVQVQRLHECVMQAFDLVLGQPGFVADPSAGSISGLCHEAGCLLPAEHYAHGSAGWPHHSCTLPAF